jgi:hypothetical protein
LKPAVQLQLAVHVDIDIRQVGTIFALKSMNKHVPRWLQSLEHSFGLGTHLEVLEEQVSHGKQSEGDEHNKGA